MSEGGRETVLGGGSVEMPGGHLLVKICGLTRLEDALEASRLGADLLGFNLWPGSRRHVTLEALSEWLPGLSGSVPRVAILVDPTLDEVLRVARAGWFEFIQFHGSETPEFCARVGDAGVPYVKAVPLVETAAAQEIMRYGAAAYLFDSFSGGQFGGTGRTGDWELAARWMKEIGGRKVFLAGGLHAGNVADAVRVVGPAGVDVAGGVEESAGVKSFDKMRIFFEAVAGFRVGEAAD